MNNQRYEIREQYYKSLLEFEAQDNEVYHAEWIKKKKEEIIEREERKSKIIEERK